MVFVVLFGGSFRRIIVLIRLFFVYLFSFIFLFKMGLGVIRGGLVFRRGNRRRGDFIK